MEIRSVDNQNVRKWVKLRQKKYRDEYGLFIVEEKHMIQEAISAGSLETLVVLSGESNPFEKEAVYVTENVMKKLSGNVSSSRYIGICRIQKPEIRNWNRIIVLENVQDPGNVGTILRTAYSFGYDGVILNNGCCSPYNDKALQSSQGAIFHLPLITDIRTEEIYKLLKDRGVTVYATALDSSSALKETEAADRYALVFGNEGQGLSEYAIQNADHSVRIEMERFESLNVASACAVCAYFFRYCKSICDKKTMRL